MASVNNVIILGNLGQNPIIRTLPSGDAVATLSVATNEVWTDAKGVKQTRTEWHRIVLFARLAEIAGEYLAKGNPVYIEGRLRTRQWQNKQGQDVWTTEIVGNRIQLLNSRGDRQPEPPLEADTKVDPLVKARAAKAAKAAAKAKPKAPEVVTGLDDNGEDALEY